MEPQRLRINQWGLDNSFATTQKEEIRLGKGGVDDAEDGQVITHEYGHAIQPKKYGRAALAPSRSAACLKARRGPIG
jgi:hypothetical protein